MNPLQFLAGLWSGQHPVSRKRKLLALGIAGLTDIVQIAFLPLFVEGAASPLEVALDIMTALSLFVVLGFKWRFLLGLVVELIPGLDLFPTWAALVLSLPSEPAPGAERPMKNVTPLPPDEPARPQKAELPPASEEIKI